VSSYPPPDLVTTEFDDVPCEWNDCDLPAVTTRYDEVSRAWLPVCEEHRR
jgi:hypothetical protein